jgi:hypothetical protein
MQLGWENAYLFLCYQLTSQLEITERERERERERGFGNKSNKEEDARIFSVEILA